MAHYPGATWRELKHNVGGVIIPRGLVFHTAADRGAPDHSSLWAFFNDPARKGTSAHGFIEGDGSAEQYIDSTHSAGHAWDANHFTMGWETHDGGHPENPWTGGQVLRMIDLMHWGRDVLGIPIQPFSGPSGSGIGYHQEYPSWNQSHHNCPGPQRVAQLAAIISLAAAVHPNPAPTPAPQPDYRRLAAGQWLPWVELLATPLSPASPSGGPVLMVQKCLNLVQGSTLTLDGVYGQSTSDAVWEFQQNVAKIAPKGIDDAFPGVFSAKTKVYLAADLSNIATGVTP